MSGSIKIYYSFLHEKNKDVEDETFYSPHQFSWASKIESNCQIVKDEVVKFLEQNQGELKPYFASEMINKPNKWKAFSFYFWGFAMSKKAIDNCPKTIKLFNKIPGLVSLSVSVLEPYSEIKPHYGDTDSVFRCHLGLEIPAQFPDCGFRVGYEDRSWEEGKLLIFNDAAYHKAWNYTSSKRVVILFDIIKQEHFNKQKWICSMVRGGIIWQIIAEKIWFLKSKRNVFTKSACFFIALLIYSFGFSLYRKSALLK